MRQPGVERITQVFDKMAGRYDRQMGFFERFVLGDARQWVVSKAAGRVLEIAVGTGLNLPRYGPEVDQVIGIDLSEGMLVQARARVAADELDRVELRHGDVQTLDLPDASVDTVVSTFTFCTIPDPLRASQEALRVLVPGGSFVLAEHGVSTNTIGRVLMRAAEPVSVRFGADHLTRDPVVYLNQAGFTIDEVHRSGRGGICYRIVARKPAE